MALFRSSDYILNYFFFYMASCPVRQECVAGSGLLCSTTPKLPAASADPQSTFLPMPSLPRGAAVTRWGSVCITAFPKEYEDSESRVRLFWKAACHVSAAVGSQRGTLLAQHEQSPGRMEPRFLTPIHVSG